MCLVAPGLVKVMVTLVPLVIVDTHGAPAKSAETVIVVGVTLMPGLITTVVFVL